MCCLLPATIGETGLRFSNAKVSLLVTLWSALAVVRASAADHGLPAPSTMSPCPAGSRFAATTERAASLIGSFLGCFISPHKASWSGTRSLTVPLEYAYAVELPSGPYTSADLTRLLSAAREQWKNFRALSEEQRATQERRLSDLVNSRSNPNSTVEEKDPVLISIRPTGESAFTVIAIRPRNLSLNGDQFRTIQVDATTLVLKSGRLLRLSIAREFRSSVDLKAVEAEMPQWVRTITSE